MSTNPDRLGKLEDLTRWNRAGLSRFAYVDGDAASWLEELRIAAMGLVARGAPMEERLPETWRGRYALDPSQWPSEVERAAFVETLAWSALARSWPERAETARRRNTRLIEQYGRAPGEHGWEIMRAAARMAHVLLGHLEAYANEGYLRTATQWENVARLAAMVNHQPSPPSSAITTVGLIVDPSDDGAAIDLPRGLAMKHTPPEGGAPVVFETLDPITVHAGLNAARGAGWSADPSALLDEDIWIDDPKADLAPGSLAVLRSEGGTLATRAVRLGAVERDGDAGTAQIILVDNSGSWTRGNVALHLNAKAVTRGLPRSVAGTLALKLATASNYPIDSLVRLHWSGGSREARVAGNGDGHLKLTGTGLPTLSDGANVTVETLVAVAGNGSDLVVSAEFHDDFYFINTLNVIASAQGQHVPAKTENGTEIGLRGFSLSHVENVVGMFWTPTQGAKREIAIVAGDPAAVVPGSSATGCVVRFAGKPPRGLAIGDIYARRPLGEDTGEALRVMGVATSDDHYTLQFDTAFADATGYQPDRHEFHGPMTRALRPLDHDRNPDFAFAGPVIHLVGLAAGACEQVRLGRKVLVEDERGIVPPVRGIVAEAVLAGDTLKLTLEPAEGLGDFLLGWTTLNINAVDAGHGETKSPKVLGSGDGERAMQRFAFAPRDVSFVPSSVAESGVAPDMDVTVGGIPWTYRDLIDPLADDTESWSSALAADGSLMIHFRRRLPTGTDNLVVRRYRTGVGPGGAIPAGVLTKPMKKHRWVRAVTQPLAATGGAGREAVEDIRINAPARLAANGRAVSLGDFERLCLRRSDIWQARAYPISDPARSEAVGIILVPAGGGAIGATLMAELVSYVETRCVPGVRVVFELYEQVRLILEASVRVNIEVFDRSRVQAAAQSALIAAFSLERRGLGQAAYIAEVVAALERVEGVETATVQTFAIPDENAVLRVAHTDGSPSAVFPHARQVVSVVPATAIADVSIKVEAL